MSTLRSITNKTYAVYGLKNFIYNNRLQNTQVKKNLSLIHVDTQTSKMSTQAVDLKKIACQAIDESTAILGQLSQEIWNNPELAFEEHKAHATLTKFLEKQGFDIEHHYTSPTGFRADFGTSEHPQPHVVVISEYDALPEIGHACGHNLIAEVGVATGIGIKAALQHALETNQQIGKVTVLGTPAEENCAGGKIDMIKHGVFNDFDFALMAHPFKITMARPLKFALDMVTVKYHGKPSHAAGFPWEGVNALDAAVCSYNNISCLRQQMKPNWRVHGIITNGGSKPNIIPENTELCFYLRAPTVAELKVLSQKATQCFQAAAMATGCEVDIEFGEKSYANMVTNSTLAGLYEANTDEAKVALCTDEALTKSPTGSTDFGNVSQLLPSIHPMYYIGTSVANHTREFAVASGTQEAQDYTLRQSKCLAMTAIDVLCNPNLLVKMKEELHGQLQQKQKQTIG
ncbi:unnamed protein product [Owenia fusiformis]|uniref:Peptidase M20 domain-containing protein 2 n=1 Tax=Owenia fusiformis TaxID=6347 RepID=A0A8J1TC05_OWEFU|nr:unnamed protein product [Owenia fusiformis]